MAETAEARRTPPLLLRRDEAAELLGYAPKTAMAMACASVLRAVRAGRHGHYRISSVSVERFAARREDS